MPINWGLVDPNTPARTAMSFEEERRGAIQNALAQKQAEQAQAMNALSLRKGMREEEDINRMRDIYRSGGDLETIAKQLQGAGYMPESLALSKEAAARQASQRKQAMDRLNTLGPMATAILSSPDKETAYQATRQQLESLFPEYAGRLPGTFAEAAPQVEQLATVWGQVNKPEYEIKDGQYVPKRPGAGGAIPIPGYKPPPDKKGASKLAKLMDERDRLPEGDPKRAFYEKAIAKELGGKPVDYKTIDDLRDHLDKLPETKTYTEVSRQIGILDKAMEDVRGTAGKPPEQRNLIAVDQALITILNKMMDPTSVVRESEYARTPSDQALLSRAKGAFQKMQEGGAGLTDIEREAIYDMGKKFAEVAGKKYAESANFYKDLAKKRELDASQIIRIPIPGEEVTKQPQGAAYGGINPATGKIEYFDTQGNRVQ